jgi:hypothetical protein
MKQLQILKIKTVLYIVLFMSFGTILADNPIIPNQGVCDPHVHIFGGKAYLFSTHDYARGKSDYTMFDWQLFSSTDLVNWTKEFVLKPEDTYLRSINTCYAPEAATRNGKYYFYFSDQQRSTGVAVSENGPSGPYKDALGKPLLPQGLTTTAQYDASVFIDDDPGKTPYIVWGYTVIEKQYHIAKLNDDMISLAESPKPIEIKNSWKNDAAHVMKRNRVYYLNSHGGEYATSNNIYGPYTYRGRFCNDQTVDHGTFFDLNNQTFFTYAVPDGSPFFRKTKIVYAHFKDNGEIAVDPFISQSPLGVAQYDANWEVIQAEWYFAASDGIKKCENKTGFEIRNITNKTYLHFPKFRNLGPNPVLSFQVSSANPNGGTIEIRKNGHKGKLLGSYKVPSTGSWTNYITIDCNIKNSENIADLYLVFKGKGDELLRLDWFKTNVTKVSAKK